MVYTVCTFCKPIHVMKLDFQAGSNHSRAAPPPRGNSLSKNFAKYTILFILAPGFLLFFSWLNFSMWVLHMSVLPQFRAMPATRMCEASQRADTNWSPANGRSWAARSRVWKPDHWPRWAAGGVGGQFTWAQWWSTLWIEKVALCTISGAEWVVLMQIAHFLTWIKSLL